MFDACEELLALLLSAPQIGESLCASEEPRVSACLGNRLLHVASFQEMAKPSLVQSLRRPVLNASLCVAAPWCHIQGLCRARLVLFNRSHSRSTRSDLAQQVGTLAAQAR